MYILSQTVHFIVPPPSTLISIYRAYILHILYILFIYFVYLSYLFICVLSVYSSCVLNVYVCTEQKGVALNFIVHMYSDNKRHSFIHSL